MADPACSEGVALAAERLRELLTHRTEYRRRWMVHAQRMRNSEISYAAVSKVVSLYLWEQGLKPDTEQDLPRRLRDRMRQALRGEHLAYETVAWLVEAFEFDAVDSYQVWDAFTGRNASDLSGGGVAFTLKSPPVPLVHPQTFRTTALFSRYYLSSSRVLDRIETSHIIVALEDGVDTYAFSPRETVTHVSVVAGGAFVGFHDSTPGFTGVELRLDRPLLRGQQASLQYMTTHRETPEPCTDLRRAARKRMNNVDMRVIFDGVRPERAWWCAWDAYSGGNATRMVDIDIVRDVELHQFVPYVEQSVVGFQWRW